MQLEHYQHPVSWAPTECDVSCGWTLCRVFCDCPTQNRKRQSEAISVSPETRRAHSMIRCLALALLAVSLLLSGCRQSPVVPASTRPATSGQYIYAAQDDGTVRIYDINHHHKEVQVIQAFACCADVRGITAAA